MVNAFTVNWGQFKGYIFPPFSLMGKLLEKILTDSGSILAKVYNSNRNDDSRTTCDLEPDLNNLQLLYQPGERHPLWKKLKLIIGR